MITVPHWLGHPIVTLRALRSKDEVFAASHSAVRLRRRFFSHDGTRNSREFSASFTIDDRRGTPTQRTAVRWNGNELRGATVDDPGHDYHGFGHGPSAIARRLFSREPGWNGRTLPHWTPRGV